MSDRNKRIVESMQEMLSNHVLIREHVWNDDKQASWVLAREGPSEPIEVIAGVGNTILIHGNWPLIRLCCEGGSCFERLMCVAHARADKLMTYASLGGTEYDAYNASEAAEKLMELRGDYNADHQYDLGKLMDEAINHVEIETSLYDYLHHNNYSFEHDTFRVVHDNLIQGQVILNHLVKILIRHREDGPAIEHADGYKSWWINGTKLTEEEFNNRYSSCTSKIVEIDGKRYKLEEV